MNPMKKISKLLILAFAIAMTGKNVMPFLQFPEQSIVTDSGLITNYEDTAYISCFDNDYLETTDN